MVFFHTQELNYFICKDKQFC